MTRSTTALAYVMMSATLVSCGSSEEDALERINERLTAIEQHYTPPSTFENNLRQLEHTAKKREPHYQRIREQTETLQKQEHLIDMLKEEALTYVKQETIDHVRDTSGETLSDFKEWSRLSLDRLTHFVRGD